MITTPLSLPLLPPIHPLHQSTLHPIPPRFFPRPKFSGSRLQNYCLHNPSPPHLRHTFLPPHLERDRVSRHPRPKERNSLKAIAGETTALQLLTKSLNPLVETLLRGKKRQRRREKERDIERYAKLMETPVCETERKRRREKGRDLHTHAKLMETLVRKTCWRCIPHELCAH